MVTKICPWDGGVCSILHVILCCHWVLLNFVGVIRILTGRSRRKAVYWWLGRSERSDDRQLR